jgi:hypothetical protein
VTELKDMKRECGNYVQVLEVSAPGDPKITIANVYDQWRNGEWPAQMANWGAIAKSARVIIAGDMNAHRTVWNCRATGRRNTAFWEKLIEDEALEVWNTEEATRVGTEARNHSIIDLTLQISSSTGVLAERPAQQAPTTRLSAGRCLGTHQWQTQRPLRAGISVGGSQREKQEKHEKQQSRRGQRYGIVTHKQ